MDHSREDIEQAQAELQRRMGVADEWDDSCEAAAGEFAARLLEAGVDRREIMRGLCAAGVSREGAKALLKAAIGARSDAERQAEEDELAGATPICPHCLAPLGQFDHFCPKCAGPVTAIASFDPMGQIYSAGRAYRLAANDKRPRGIVVLAMWLIFGPQVVGVFSLVCWLLFSWHWFEYDYMGGIGALGLLEPALKLLLLLGFLVLFSAILIKVTVHWLHGQSQVAEDGQADDGQDEAGQAGDDGQANDGQTGDGQANDGQTGDRQVEDSDR